MDEHKQHAGPLTKEATPKFKQIVGSPEKDTPLASRLNASSAWRSPFSKDYETLPSQGNAWVPPLAIHTDNATPVPQTQKIKRKRKASAGPRRSHTVMNSKSKSKLDVALDSDTLEQYK